MLLLLFIFLQVLQFIRNQCYIVFFKYIYKYIYLEKRSLNAA